MLLNLYILFLTSTSILASTDKIVGGRDAFPGEVKFQVSLGFSFVVGAPPDPSSHVCGGAVVRDVWVLTTARCCRGGIPELFHVVAGMTAINSTTETLDRQIKFVEETITHESYNPITLDNDICLVRVDSPFQKTDFVGEISLASATPEVGETVSVSGWGLTSENGLQMSQHLQVAELLIHDHADCASKYSENEIKVTANMVCAYRRGLLGGKFDACEGDGGGPLYASNGTHQELVGLTSWGLGCGRRDMPGVYTDVSKYREWIQGKTRDLGGSNRGQTLTSNFYSSLNFLWMTLLVTKYFGSSL